MSTAKIRALKHDAGGFDIDEFVTKLVTFMGGRRAEEAAEEEDFEEDFAAPLQWHKIGREALGFSRRVVGASTM